LLALETNSSIQSEISFVLEKLEVAIDNECSWNYLRAIQNHILTANTGNYQDYPETPELERFLQSWATSS